MVLKLCFLGLFAMVSLILQGCGEANQAPTPRSQMHASNKHGPDSQAPGNQAKLANKTFLHSGMCDASAGVAIGRDQFLVANDEDNILRLYDVEKNAGPVAVFDLREHLKVNAEMREADIEGAARVENRVFWIGSHGRNKNGKWRPGRHVYFATTIKEKSEGVSVTPAGLVYHNLAADIIAETFHADLNLAKAIQPNDPSDKDLAPKDKGFNIEGLAVAPGGEGLLIGLRNPRRKKNAIVLWLKNPAALVDGNSRADWNKPLLWDLDDRGVRDFIFVQRTKQYLIIAGPHDSTRRFALYAWSGKREEQPKMLRQLKFERFTPEALIAFDDGRLQLLGDNGSTLIEGQACKDLADSTSRYFQSRFIVVPTLDSDTN